MNERQKEFATSVLANGLHCAVSDSAVHHMSSRERHRILEQVAQNKPSLIEDQIRHFQRKIELLREYLPAEDQSHGS